MTARQVIQVYQRFGYWFHLHCQGYDPDDRENYTDFCGRENYETYMN